MKRIMRLFMLLLAAVLLPFTTTSAQDVWDGTVAESFAGGTGKADDPYLIETGAELAYLAKITKENGSQTSGKYYKLIADIVLNDDVLDDNLKLKTGNIASFKEWIPIGYGNNSNSFSDPYSFMGYFDGAGHVISGVYVVNHGNRYAGLFGVCDGGEIHNLAVVDSYIDATDAYGAAVIAGHLLGYSGSTSGMKVYQCFAEGYVSGGTNAGLIVGHNGGENALISESYCYGHVLSAEAIGAVAGYCDRGSIQNCYSVALTGANGTASVYRGDVTNIYYDSTVNSQGNYATGKTTEEMKSEEFARLLGAPFVYAEGKYPYIDGLPVLGERTSVLSGLRLRVGELTNGHGSTVKFYREYDGTDVSKSAFRAEAGDTVYVKVTPYKRMLITGGAPVVTNDVTGAAVKLTALPNSIWSFIMPESNVTVTAKFYKDPKAPIAWDGSVAESFAGGTGTQDDPYLISNAEELAYLSKFTKENPGKTTGKYYQLTDNILLNENVLNENYQLDGTPENIWVPIGDPECTSTYNPGNNDFQGIFDGAGHVISGMYCPSEYEMAGLFGSLSGQVHNLAVVDSYVTGGRFVGLIVGGMQVNCNVSRCYAAGYAKSNRNSDSYVGLITGHLYNNCVLEYCYSTGCVNVGYATGGLTGWIDYHSSTVRNCFTVADAGNGAIGGGGGTSKNNYFDNTIGNVSGNGIGKGTEEMQSESFAQLLGEPFVYAEGNYPYIEGLPMVGEEVEFATSGFRLNCGTLVNGKGSSIKYYREFDGTDVDNSARRAEVGETVYVKVSPHKRMLLTDGSLKLVNDETGKTVMLTSVGENIWSFTMPEYSVSITAAFHRNPDLPLVWMGDVADSFAGGSGTQEDPYQISNGDELAYLAKLTMANGVKTKGVYYKLTADIILNEDVLTAGHQLNEAGVNDFCKWTPIGRYISDSDLSQTFQGYFDGNGYSISGIYCPDNEFAAGLFGHIYNGNVHDLSVLDTYVKASNLGGGIAGYLQSTSETETARIYNCYAEACVVGGYSMGLAVGHVAGSYSSVDHCYTYGCVSGSYPAGIVGYLSAGRVEKCYSVCKSGYNGVYNNYSTVNELYFDSTVNSYGRNATGKTTNEMQSEAFVDLLGEPFEYVDGNYPYIDGLRQIGQGYTDKATGYRTNVGAMSNANGCTIKFFAMNGDVLKMVRRSEAGEKVYLRPILTHHMLMAESDLVLTNDATGKKIALEKEGTNIYSFTMPEAEVTVTARFYINPKQAMAWDGSVADSFAGGTGTKEDPYQISNGAELAYLAKITNANTSATKGQYYRLTNDIVLNADVLDSDYQLIGTPQNQWTPIGTSNNYRFYGDFDGGNHVISGLYAVGGQSIGLFGFSSGCIHDLAVVDAYLYNPSYSVGIICGSGLRSDSISISRCYAEGYVYGYYTGLLLGSDNGRSTVEYCYGTGVVNTGYTAGGLVGDMYADMNHCYVVTKVDPNRGHGLVKITHSNTFVHLYYDRSLSPSVPVGISDNATCAGKSTGEMISQSLADMLGEPFAYSFGDYPYIPGLPKIDEPVEFASAGYHVNIGTLVNTCGSSVAYYSDFDGKKVSNGISCANPGETVYLKMDLGRRMLLLDGTLKVVNDTTGEVLTLTSEAEGIWSFTMPDFSVTVSASFHRDPNLPDVWEGDIAPEFAEGEGTEDDPYLIHDGAELAYLAQLCNANGELTKGKYYELASDIVLNEDVLNDDFSLNGTPANVWTPIGKDKNNAFQGVFDGKNHKIEGVYIPSGDNAAFFGYTKNAKISNLSLIDTYVYSCSSIAALICDMSATDTSYVSRCYVEASVISCSTYWTYYVAGLVNTLGEKCGIEYCYTSGQISGGAKGGLVRSMSTGSTVRNCFTVMKGATAISSYDKEWVENVYSDEDLGGSFSETPDFCSKHTIEMHTTDFASRMGEPFEYVLGNYPYIPGLMKIGENRGWQAPEDPTHGGAGEVWDGETSVIFASGTGTEADPYIINNGAQLSYLAKLTNANGDLTKDKYYQLGADISLNADSVLTKEFELNGTPTNIWEPIGKDSNHKFQGVFDGNNHKIEGVYIPSGDNAAFFGYTKNAKISNLSLIDTYVYSCSSIAALICDMSATDTSYVSRCYVEASVISCSTYWTYYVAGLVNTLGEKCGIEYCYTSGQISGGAKGGLVRSMSTGSTVRNCFTVMKGATAISSYDKDWVENVYSDEDLGGLFSETPDFCSKHTIEMHTTDFASRMGEPFEYVLGNYPYIPGLMKIGENRGWKAPEDPAHGGAGGTWDGATSIIFASGTGTEAEPYIINNGAQLSYLAKLTNANGDLTKDKYYQLGADISLNADSVLTKEFELNGTPTNIWEPIGKDSNHKFQGVFDGNNHKIEGVYIPSGDNAAFFGYTKNAKISNLSLIDTYVYSCSSIAALICDMSATDTSYVSRCYVEASVISCSTYWTYYVAGLVNTLGEKCGIEYCYTSGQISGGAKGGLVRSMSTGSTVRNCFTVMKGATAISSYDKEWVENVYSDEDLGGSFSETPDFCSKHTIEMHTTDFASRMGEPFEYVLGNYPYIPGLMKIGENRGWQAPEDPTHGGAGEVWDGETSVIFASGTGTEADPYIINNGAQLSYLAKLTNANGDLTKGRHYRLEADIKLNEKVLTDTYKVVETPLNIWEPIGQDSNHKFQGVFDGNNYTVSGVYITSDYNAGFFGYTNDAKISNLSLIDTYVNNYNSSAAALICEMSATDTSYVSRCYVDAFVDCSSTYYTYYVAGLVNLVKEKCGIEYCYTSGQINGGSKGGIARATLAGSTVKNCFSAMKGASAIFSASGDVSNVYFDSDLAGTTSNISDDFRSAETPEMLSTDFATRMGEPFEYAVGYYPYIYGLHKIDSEGRTSIVTGYPLQLGKLENGSDCDIEFYRGYHKKHKTLSLPVVPGSKVFVDNATTIYVKVSPASLKRLSEDGLKVTANTTGTKLNVTEVDYDLYSFQITDDAVTVSAAFLDGNFCGDPEVNNGRDVKWVLNGDKSKMTIAGAGKMVVGNWIPFSNNVQTIEVGEGVTNIPAQAFKGMSKATTVTLPATVEAIGAEAFSGCSATVDLRACTQITALHANEFAQFMGTVYLPATVTMIESDAFAGTFAGVKHIYSPVLDGKTLYANDKQVHDANGVGDIKDFGVTKNEAVALVWYTGYNVNTGTIAGANCALKFFADEAMTTEIPNGYKAIREDDATKVYVKALPGTTSILFVNGLTVKAGSSTLAVTQESDDVFSFLMPAADVTISAKYSTGGYCGENGVNNGHNLIWTLNNGTLAFQKNTLAVDNSLNMGSWASGKAPWNALGGSIKSVDLSGVKNIGNNAFSSCTELTGLELPASPVITVGENAFAEQMVLIIPAESWDGYQKAGWDAYAEQTAKDKESFSMKDGQQWRTYYSKVGRLLPSGLKAYTITGIGSAEVSVSKEMDYVPAGQAVLIENAGKEACTAEVVTSLQPYSQLSTPVCLLTTEEDNLLQWITVPTVVTAGQGYTLYKDEFVKVTSGTLPAGVAFLPAQGVAASRLFIFNEGDKETGIDIVEEVAGNDQWYTLDGKKLSGKPTVKGLYIRNGQKVMTK